MSTEQPKVALVTGAASGIGEATVRRLAADGVRVCVVDVDPKGEAVAKELDGVFVAADVSSFEENERAVERCVKEFGRIDWAYLNAGITTGETDVAKLTTDRYEKVVRINLDGVIHGVRAIVPVMRGRAGGSIVATASVLGLMPFPHDWLYSATKAAISAFVRSLAPLLSADGIRLHAVAPGAVETPMAARFGDFVTQLRAANYPMLSPDQIASSVATLLADTDSDPGQTWVCQPGRLLVPYKFSGVPGPKKV